MKNLKSLKTNSISIITIITISLSIMIFCQCKSTTLDDGMEFEDIENVQK